MPPAPSQNRSPQKLRTHRRLPSRHLPSRHLCLRSWRGPRKSRTHGTGTAIHVQRCAPRPIKLDNANRLVQQMHASIQRNPHALISLARIKSADNYTYLHSGRRTR